MLTPEVLRQIRRVQIRVRRAVQSLVGGQYHSAFRGAGVTFEDVREYQPGDDVRRIDWNVTARTGRPFLKRFVEERELTILLAVDLSGSLRFGSRVSTKRRVAAEVAALLAMAAIQNGDRVGLLAFTDRIERYVPPGRGHHQAVRLLCDMLSFEPVGRGTDLASALREIRRIQPRRGIVFVLSDFQDDNYEGEFRHAASHHDLIAVRLSDPLELEFPSVGLITVHDPETGLTQIINASGLAEDYATQARTRTDALNQLVRSSKAEVIEISTAGGHFDAITDFLRRRERRRRP